MKSTQLPLVKSIVDLMTGVCREMSGKTASEPVPVILRVSKGSGDVRCVQVVTTVGVVTLLDDGKLTELDYPVVDIGTTDNWTKVSKGIICTKQEPMIVPVDRAADVAAFSDSEIDLAVSLLRSDTALPPVSVIFNPGNTLVLSDAGGKSLIWAYDPAGQRQGSANPYANLSSTWTKNPLKCDDGLYGVVRAWQRAVAFAFPKDPQTGQPTKIDGLAFSRIGGHACIRIVSRELGLVVSMICSRLSDKYGSVSYVDSNNVLTTCSIQSNYTYTKNMKEDSSMEVKMIDIAQVRAKPAAAQQVSVAAEPAVQRSVKPAVEQVTPTATDTVVAAAAPEATTTPAAEMQQPVAAPEAAPAQAPAATKTSDELLQEALTMCSEVAGIVKAIQTAVRAVTKLHKQEIKELKSNVKESEELTKLRAAHKRLKALLLESES